MTKTIKQRDTFRKFGKYLSANCVLHTTIILISVRIGSYWYNILRSLLDGLHRREYIFASHICLHIFLKPPFYLLLARFVFM